MAKKIGYKFGELEEKAEDIIASVRKIIKDLRPSGDKYNANYSDEDVCRMLRSTIGSNGKNCDYYGSIPVCLLSESDSRAQKCKYYTQIRQPDFAVEPRCVQHKLQRAHCIKVEHAI